MDVFRTYRRSAPEPKEEPRLHDCDDCPSCFTPVKLHSLGSIDVRTNSEEKLFFFYNLLVGPADWQTDRQTDKVATEDFYQRLLESDGWERGMVKRPKGAGLPVGRTRPLPVHVPVMSRRRDLSYQWMNTYLSACFGSTAMGNITWFLLNDLYSCSFIKDLLYRCII